MERIDRIERSVIFSTPPARVWAAITQPEQISKWFGTQAEFAALRVGEPMLLGWGADQYQGVIERVEPEHVFGYRWEVRPGGAALEDLYWTHVTFTLEAIAEGTRLTVRETGFAALPDDIYNRAYKENAGGWKAELDDLAAYLSA